MRILYALILLVGFTQISFAQSLELTPVKGNAVMRTAAIKEDLKNKKYKKYLEDQHLSRTTIGECPVFFDINLVESGNQVFVGLDTADLGGGTIGDSLFFTPCQPLVYGDFISISGIDFIYEANDEVENLPAGEGAQTEIVCLTFHREDPMLEDTLLQYAVTVKRKGQTIDNIAPINIAPRTVEVHRLDTPSNRFPTPITCSELFNQDDPLYDGEGVDGQWESFTNYTFPDTAVQYGSNRHPGTDNVSIVLCDELLICDTFIVPFVIPIDRIEPDFVNDFEVFFDDFSYDGFRPNPDLWLDRQVYKNNTLAVNPPSIGVATFDGLNHRGEPYDIDFEGIGDILTSRPIDLSGWDEDDNFTFRFFVQRKGLGLGPSFADSIYLEFKVTVNDGIDETTEWQYQTGFTGFQNQVSSDSIEAFQFAIVDMDDDDFFHEDFQFRFVAATSPGEVYDLWHLDYVSLDRNGFVDQTFRDVTFVEAPTDFLRNYRHMPLNHLLPEIQTEITDTIGGVFFNHNDIQPISLNTTARANYVELYSGEDFGANFLIAASGASNNLDPQTRDAISNDLETSEISTLVSKLQGFSADDNILIESVFSYVDPANPLNLFFPNDFVTLHTRLDSIFAYDDGTAEGQVFFTGNSGGEEFAQRYYANVNDKITGVQINFPYVNGDVQNQEFKIRIYQDELDNANMIYESEILNPFYLNELLFLDTLDGFTTYALVENEDGDTININGGQDFYIGFVQVSDVAEGIPIGSDFNNPRDTGDIRFRIADTTPFNNANNLLRGSIMMRPIVASGNGYPDDSTAGVNDTRPINQVMNIYPNPASNQVFVNLIEGQYQDYQMTLFNNVGQVVNSQILKKEISISNYPNGMYFLRIDNLKTRESFQHKLIIVD